jgi:hypothetical protein
MTRTISLIIGIAVVALLAVPTALGEGTEPGTYPDANKRSITTSGWSQPAVQFFYTNERATMTSESSQPAIGAWQPFSSNVVSENTPESALLRAERLRSEALNKKYGLGEFAASPVSTYKDANERVVEPQSVRAERLRSEGLNRMYGLGEFSPTVNYKDANERVDLPTTTPADVPVATSGRDVEWPQIGIGFGIGIALAIGLGLSLKATRPRTLAH